MTRVHYFYDPICGWCYAAASLTAVLAEMPEFEVVYHPGGMIPKRAIDPSFRQHILQADKQIAQMTKVHFGDNYIARVKGPEDYVVDSLVTTQAIIVGEEMGLDNHTMLAALQNAHYQEGKHLHELDVLAELAVSLGLDKTIWNEKMAKSETTLNHKLAESHQLMGQMQVSGYPTFIIEKDNRLMRLPHSNYYGKAEEWKSYLAGLV
ncbi:DsbA family protein [Marinomonas sp.]|uniref:DsbA family protein n=1 Tax=Marinomonas sp. TaxID=1904862 RepID=UPI003BAAA118